MKRQPISIDGIPAVLLGKRSDNLYIYIHGRYSCKEAAERLANIVTERKYQVLSFDLPEHGERKSNPHPFNIQNAVSDLESVFSFAAGNYTDLSLYACSIGAFFSLIAFSNYKFRRCLFESPIVDMEKIIVNMMTLAAVTEDELRLRNEIPTEFGEILSWDYYSYVKARPVIKWDSSTHILYGEKDSLTDLGVIKKFTDRFDCKLNIMAGGEHYFHKAEQVEYLENWIKSTSV